MSKDKEVKADATTKQETVSPISMEDIVKLIKTMTEQNKEFAGELAKNLLNPPPSDDEVRKRQSDMQDKIELAKIEEASKEERRKYCRPPANPAAPHRRSGQQWGQFNGTSVIAWGFQQFAYKDTDGKMKLTPEQPVGVCQWCHTDFRPGDPGYDEAISWGISQVYGTFPINRHTGHWE